MSQQQDPPKLSKAESARINGSKSYGATSEAGKLRAANGNLKHGAYSSRVLMDDENPEALAILSKCFHDVFQPQDPFECELVTTLADTRWRIRRMEAAESARLNDALLLRKDYLHKTYDAIDARHERSFAVDAQIHTIDIHTRVEERLHRIYERTHKLLFKHRRELGRSMPPAHLPSDAESPQPEAPPPPTPSPEPVAEESNLKSPPNSPVPAQPSAASIIGNVAMILVIFALLLLSSASRITPKLSASASQPAIYSENRLHRGSGTLLNSSGRQK